MIFCRGCGAQIHETAVTCPKCGAVQGVGPAAVPGAAPVANEPMWPQIIAIVLSLVLFGAFFDESEWDVQQNIGAVSLGVTALIIAIACLSNQTTNKGISATAVVMASLAALGAIAVAFF